MEPISAELLRLATELDAVRGQVQTECNALRDLFARSSHVKLRFTARPKDTYHSNSVEAVLTTVTLRFGWRAMRQESGREVAKLEKFEDNTIETRSYWDVQQSSAAMTKEDSQCEPWRRTSSLARSHAMVLARLVVEQSASMARLISPKRTKNVNELQVAAMPWELTLVEHEPNSQRW